MKALSVISILAAIVTLMVAGLILMIPFSSLGRRDDIGTGLWLFALGLLGVLAGLCIARSAWLNKTWPWGMAGFMFAVSYLGLIFPVYLGVGHLYGPTALLLFVLAVLNLHKSDRKV